MFCSNRESAAFVLVFSLASLKSLDRIRLFYNTVVRVQRSDPIVILVGNKLDQKRVVPVQEAVDFARAIGATYIETSAKTAHNVSLAFTEPITRLRNKHAHVGASYDLKGRLALPLNPQSIEAPPGAIAAVEAQERARAASGRRPSNEVQNQIFPAGPILEASMPLNQLLLGRYPEGPTDEPPGYGPGGQTGPSVFEHQLPPGTVIPRSSSQTGSSTPRGGMRSRSGTNASIPSSPWSQHGAPPVPIRNTRSANIVSEESRPTRKMSDPQSPVVPPRHRPVEKPAAKRKGGSLANMLSTRKSKKIVDSGKPGTDKDSNCVVQ